MTLFEVATGWLTGEDTAFTSDPVDVDSTTPLAALEALLAPALARPPCVVAFSGGRDSSVLLAVANRLAIREGLPVPVAATLRYPGEHGAHEKKWQELVVRHLGIKDWEIIDAGDAADLLGPAATNGLKRRGLLWPPAHYTILPLLGIAVDGTLVTGDGGDEVFGDHRITPLVRAFTGHWPKTRSDAKETLLAPAPRMVRQTAYARSLRAQLRRSWLRPAAQERFARALATDRARAPLGWQASLRRLPRMRAWYLGFHNQDLVAAADGVRSIRPLQDPLFLVALARSGPPWGFSGRDAAMQGLFASLLPDEVLRRESKALFNRVVFGEHSRDFVERWTGAGVPDELVDAEVLRRFWLAPSPHALSFALLQAAWLAETAPSDGTGTAQINGNHHGPADAAARART
jgi:hypothetical protein